MAKNNMKIYNFKIKNLNRKEIDFNEFKNKVLLLVNTASKCGLTPQYEGLEKLYKKYKDKGLVIIGFPCDQFAHQEYDNAKDIKEQCLINYGVTFKITEKIDVNGKNTHSIFKYLKDNSKSFLGMKKIKWNFTKFLVDSKGEKILRFSPTTKPEEIEKDIVKLLNEIK